MSDNLMDVERRIKRYWYSDGLAEISVGGMFLLLGLYFAVQGYFGEGSTVSVILQTGMILVMLAGFMATQWLVNTLKSRLTYPRTGYVEYRVKDNDAKQRRYVVIAVAAMIAVASMVLINYIRDLDSMVLGTGFLIGVIFIVLRGKSSGVTRFYYLGGFSLLLGIALSFDKLPQAYNLGLFYCLLGVALLISGGLVLRRYLRENPMPTEGDDE